MERRKPGIARLLRWIWARASAAVALLLVVAALFIGYRIGRPGGDSHGGAREPASRGDAAGRQRMYTCAMHPAVRLPDPDAKCPICFMSLIPVPDETEGGELPGGRQLLLGRAAAELSRIETVEAARRFPVAEVRLFGKVAYDETRVARLTAYFPGRIDRLFANYPGVVVKKGHHLAEIYSPELLAAFEELRQARQAVDAPGTGSELVRRATRGTLEAAREKLRLFGLTESQVAAVEDGSHDSDRLTIFAPIGGVVTHLAVREGDYVKTGSAIATVADLSRLWLDMEAYESQLPLLRWGQPATFTVEALPGERFEGRISFIQPGVDARTRTSAVRLAVDNGAGRLKPGMLATAVVEVRIAEGGPAAAGDLAGKWVSPMHPEVVKDAPGQCDVCGMDLVAAESLGVAGDPSEDREPLVIPGSAVLFTGVRSIVYVERSEQDRLLYEGREVVIGPRAGGYYVVREGLEEGDRVVVNGAFRIDSAMQIAARPSMMSPSGGGGGGHAHGGHPGGPGRAPAGQAAGAAFEASLEPVFDAYFEAAAALAKDDVSSFLAARERMDRAVAAVEDAGLAGSALGAWRRAASKLRTAGRVESIGEARDVFSEISEGAIDLQRRFGHRGPGPRFLVHCPMAFENQGASWLQTAEAIDNPYFGAAMLRCGDVRERFAPRSAPARGGEHEGHGGPDRK